MFLADCFSRSLGKNVHSVHYAHAPIYEIKACTKMHIGNQFMGTQLSNKLKPYFGFTLALAFGSQEVAITATILFSHKIYYQGC